jgi:hypothetical protein
MGLSDQERRGNLYYNIDQMVSLGDSLRDKSRRYTRTVELKKLLNLLDRLWPAFLGSTSNGLHWIMGSSASNKVTGENKSPWDTRIAAMIEDVQKESQENDEIPNRDEFDYADWWGIERLLPGDETQKIYEIFAWSEQVIYSLRRYGDEFLESLKELSDLIASIQGECFHLFHEDRKYLRAYLIHNILELAVNMYDDNDIVTQMVKKQHWHHNFANKTDIDHEEALPTIKLLDMFEALTRTYHNKVKNGGSWTTEENTMQRLEACLIIMGHSYHYKHEHKEFFDMFLTTMCIKHVRQQKAKLLQKRIEEILAKYCTHKETKYRDDSHIEELFFTENPWTEKEEQHIKKLKKEAETKIIHKVKRHASKSLHK